MNAAPPAPSTVFRGLGLVALITWLFLAFRGFESPLAWAVFVVVTGVCVFVPAIGERALAALRRPTMHTFVAACAALAALISYSVVSSALHDRPSVIDANVYLFQARALSHGHFGMPIPEPRQLFGARFLFAGDDGRMYGVFPPGFPLFLVPFVWIGAPMLAGPVVAALLVFAQWLLGDAIDREGTATRLAILLSLPSVARAVETADLLSHAFVAVMGTIAIALAVRERAESSRARLLLIGGALGWATTARLLDGVLFSAIVAVLLAGRMPLRRAILPLLTLLPFLTFLLFAQKAATGSFLVPTQTLYFARSDWPPTCHRLGLGVDVGCAVEHGDERATFGADGYSLRDALRVVRERAGALGADLFGFAPIALAGFAAVIVRAQKRDAFLAASILGFTIAYGLFYYGNSGVYGARHLFPIAPLFWLLVARGLSDPLHPRLGASLAVSALALGSLVAVPRWLLSTRALRADAEKRIDIRGIVERSELPRGLVVTGDELSYLAAFDPYVDGRDRVIVRFDGSGLKDLRRAYPELPVHSVLAGDTHQSQQLAAPPPGLLVELERAWPSFVRPNGVGTRVVNAKNCCGAEASGDRVLFIFQSREGASLSIPFTLARAGRFALRVDGLVAPDYGNWSMRVDHHALPDWDGYADVVAHRQGTPSAPIDLLAGAHTITFTCTGKRAESRGTLAAFDALVGYLPTP
jgi:hypothetical protein